MSDRRLNIFLLFTLVFIFILFGEEDVHTRILWAFVLATAFSLTAFIFHWLTIDGMAASIILGTIAYGFGGLTGAAVILVFMITGSILSKDIVNRDGQWEKKFRRNGNQVWANGFWFTLFIMIWFLSKNDIFLVAAVSSVAMTTADTWASEIGGHRLKAKSFLITTGEKVTPGTDGGISIYGSLSSVCGALLISLVFGGVFRGAGLLSIIIIFVTGLTGSFIDSYLGAKFQHNTYRFKALSIIGINSLCISNSFVNWAASGITSIISLILILILGT